MGAASIKESSINRIDLIASIKKIQPLPYFFLKSDFCLWQQPKRASTMHALCYGFCQSLKVRATNLENVKKKIDMLRKA
ncbi:hypothetical protein D770_10740 [Flammeovirgaceae bacterium 311]|nr:hypothetical protein D770_10740 [Flammeovirgaceae bacterium 311]